MIIKKDEFEKQKLLINQFLRLYLMAYCDSNFKEAERRFLYDFAMKRGVSKERLDDIISISKISGELEIPKTYSKIIDYLYDLCLMIWADGEVSHYERIALKKYCMRFGFLDKNNNIEYLSEYLLKCAYKKVAKKEVISEVKITKVGKFLKFENTNRSIKDISISSHAKQRYNERKLKTTNLHKIKEDALKAFNEGKRISEVKGKHKQYIYQKIKKYPSSIIRIYQEYLWIFRDKKVYELVTLYHLDGSIC